MTQHPSPERIRELIEDAIMDAYDEEEQIVGFLTMIEENLGTPFKTKIIGEEVEVSAISVGENNELLAECKRNGKKYKVGLNSLEFDDPPPEGYEWVIAFREWKSGNY